VAVNTDASVRRLKGPGRPVNPLEHRMGLLASLRAVDWVVAFDGSVDASGCRSDTPLDIIRKVGPDVLVKGGDYRMEEIVGAQEVLAAGGEVRILPLVAGQSTTGLIARIADRKG
jgi:D-beta-D-heptose 7-phosphate kinase/D-beta-D-heptose 1-phosphate adenosyltransferase